MRIVWIFLFFLITSTLSFKCLHAQNQKKERFRVIVTTDFPPIGVVKGGDDAPNTLKSDPENPTQPSWGGQYVRKKNTNHYVDGPGSSSSSMWCEDYQKEFKEGADWCIQANH